MRAAVLPWLCCYPCALCQEARTVKLIDDNGQWNGGQQCMAPPMQQPLMGQQQYYS
jgi:hypothetical protein